MLRWVRGVGAGDWTTSRGRLILWWVRGAGKKPRCAAALEVPVARASVEVSVVGSDSSVPMEGALVLLPIFAL
jgi:hypothetical protein